MIVHRFSIVLYGARLGVENSVALVAELLQVHLDVLHALVLGVQVAAELAKSLSYFYRCIFLVGFVRTYHVQKCKNAVTVKHFSGQFFNDNQYGDVLGFVL